MTSVIVTVIRAVLATVLSICSIHTSCNQIVYKTQWQRKTLWCM